MVPFQENWHRRHSGRGWNDLTRKAGVKKRNLPLSPKWAAFCREYMIDRKQAAAARRAGFKVKDNSKQGYKLMQDPRVKTEIARLEKLAAGRAEMKTDEVIRIMERIAKSDIRKLFDQFGNLIPLHELPDEIAGAVTSFEFNEIVSKDGTVRRHTKIKLASKDNVLNMLARYHAIFRDVETGKDEATILAGLPDNELDKLRRDLESEIRQSPAPSSASRDITAA